MGRIRRFLAAVFVFVLVGAAPVVATEGTETTEGSAETAVTEAVQTDYQPAVTVAEEEPAEIVQPWTNRYLIPTMAALAAVLLFVTVVQYFLRVVKARYKVVE